MSIVFEDWFTRRAKGELEKMVIPEELYSRWNVKRGLRNQDGTGVLVGLTKIGDVHGYILDEGEKIPERGRLYYRGVNVVDLVNGFQKEKRFGFEETAYLLLMGKLPNESELNEFNQLLADKRNLPYHFIEDIILTAHSNNVMNKLARCVLSLYSFDPTAEEQSLAAVLAQSIDLVAKFPLLAAYSYQAKAHYYDKKSLFIHESDPNLSTAENFLQLIRPNKKYTPLEAELLDLCLVLHAEHGGGNNSAFTVHVVSSSETDTYSTIAAGIGSLKGKKHGGANIEVADMIDNLKATVEDWRDSSQVFDYLCNVMRGKAHDGTGLIYGMGHAVYTLSDPRAEVLKVKAQELAEKSGRLDEYKLYSSIEEMTPAVFEKVKGQSRSVCANVDLYSGFVYEMLNIPRDLFTPLFAVSRITGWCAHRLEEIIGGKKIIRPAYKSIVQKENYTPLVERKG